MKVFSINKGILKTKIRILGIKITVKHDFKKIVTKNYTKKLAELQNIYGKRKIKVGFLVNEQAKWQYQSLYEEMEKSDYFEPVVLVTQLTFAHLGQKYFYKTIEDCYNFFVDKGLNVRYVYDIDKKEYIHSKYFNVDILFYQQPWCIDDSQHPFFASKSMLTCYVPYGLNLAEFGGDYKKDFHEMLWLMFVETDINIQSFSKEHDVSNCVAVGYSKLDDYFSEENNFKFFHNKNPIIIYAPHHSFESDGLRCATFQNNGMDILALAQKYKDQINWVFKPHPRFKTAVVSNNIMSEDGINDYYHEWEKLGIVYDNGNYFRLFKQSNALITDCVSFLGEYLPSTNPIFHLISPYSKFNDLAKSFIGSFYQIYSVSELEENLKKVILEHQDIKKDERVSKISILFDKKEKASTKIIKKLTNILKCL